VPLSFAQLYLDCIHDDADSNPVPVPMADVREDPFKFCRGLMMSGQPKGTSESSSRPDNIVMKAPSRLGVLGNSRVCIRGDAHDIVKHYADGPGGKTCPHTTHRFTFRN